MINKVPGPPLENSMSGRGPWAGSFSHGAVASRGEPPGTKPSQHLLCVPDDSSASFRWSFLNLTAALCFSHHTSILRMRKLKVREVKSFTPDHQIPSKKQLLPILYSFAWMARNLFSVWNYQVIGGEMLNFLIILAETYLTLQLQQCGIIYRLSYSFIQKASPIL